MNRIGFRNFRRFVDFPPLEYKGITFFVGRNNSGKSTVVKALLLLDQYFRSNQIKTLSFGNKRLQDANIVTFGRAKNSKSNSSHIIFTHQIKEFYIELIVSGAEDNTFADVESVLIADQSLGVNYFFSEYFNHLSISRANLLEPEKKYSKSESEQILKQSLREIAGKVNNSFLKKSSREYIQLMDDFNLIHKKLQLLKEQESTDHENEVFVYSSEEINGSTFKDIVRDTVAKAIAEYHADYNKIQQGDKPSKAFADLKGIRENERVILESSKNFDQLVTKSSTVIYLGAASMKQSALFSIRDTNNALAQAIHEYYQLKVTDGEPAHRFIERWMKEFEVGDEFEIELFSGEAYGVTIFSNETAIPLADKGMGSVQAMLLIFRLASIIHKVEDNQRVHTVVIEEPELNLHPALQSKLTDLFLEVHENYGIDFIIETHSEYMIRRSQVFVAQNEYEVAPNENPFNVYYFPKDPGQAPYRLPYNEDGSFKLNFGEGFFDEASSKTLQLLKLKRQKQK